MSVDDLGRLMLNGKPIDVTTRGVTAVSSIVERTWQAMRVSVVEMAKTWFQKHPEDVPSPNDVDLSMIGFIGGDSANPFEAEPESHPN